MSSLFERENEKWVNAQLEKLPYRYRERAKISHASVLAEIEHDLIASGMVEHIARTRRYRVANERLRDYVERVQAMLRGECEAPTGKN